MASGNSLPQAGTSLSEAGESRSASALCPSYSGGGTNRHESSSSQLSGRGRSMGFFRKPKTRSDRSGEESDSSVMSAASLVSSASDLSRPLVRKGKRKQDTAQAEAEIAPKSKEPRHASSELVLFTKNNSEEDEVFDPSVPPKHTRTKGKLPKAEELGREMQAQPSEELGACIKIQLETVEKIADKSKNLRGDYTHGLRLAVRKVSAAVAELAQRTDANSNVERLERENAELRARMAELTTKVERLTDAVRERTDSQVSSANLAKPDSTPPVVKGKDWEREFMERIGELMDRKLAVVLGQPASPLAKQNSSAPAKGPPGKANAKRSPPETSPPQVQRPMAEAQAPPAASVWSKVVGRKKKRKPKQRAPEPAKSSPTTSAKTGPKATPKAGQSAGKKATPARVPTSAAITVTVPEGSDVTLAAVMATAKARIRLADVGVDTVRSKKAITGGLILEVSGPDCTSKADALAERMRVALADLGVRVARPVKTGELRLKDLDDSVTPREVLVAVAEAGGCSTDDVRVGDIRRSPTALGTVWVRCPLACVRKLAAAGHIVVGWVSARVDYLTSRPLQCFRCLEFGHVRSICQSAVDRSTLCYACGEPDHRASRCTRPPRCPLCSDKGCRADHRMGSKRCSPPKDKRKAAPPPSRSDPAPEAKAAPTKGAAQSGQSPPSQEAMEAS